MKIWEYIVLGYIINIVLVIILKIKDKPSGSTGEDGMENALIFFIGLVPYLILIMLIRVLILKIAEKIK